MCESRRGKMLMIVIMAGKEIKVMIKRVRTENEIGFEKICNEVLINLGLNLYDLEYRPASKLLRIYIMNPSTKTALIDDCIKVDHALTPYFENETWIPENIVLEVSSPGVNRHLVTLDHFQMVRGQNITLTLNNELDLSYMTKDEQGEVPKAIRTARKLTGKLEEVNVSEIILNIKDRNYKISGEQIKKANVEAV